MIYYIAFLTLIIVQYVFWSKDKNTLRIFLPICIIELIFFTSFRGHDIGSDIIGYLKYYNTIKYYISIDAFGENILNTLNNVRNRYEIGYVIFNILCAIIGLNETGFLFILSLLTYIPLYFYIKKYSVMPLISFLAYFALELFSFSLGIFRQSMAVTIVMIGIIYLDKIKVKQWLLICLMASLFHKTSLIAIPIYWFRKMDLKITYRMLFLSGFVFVFIGRYIVDSIASNLYYYSDFIGSVYDTQGGYFLLLTYLLVSLFSYFVTPFNKTSESDRVFLISLPVICNLLVLSSQFGILIRFIQYYTILAIIAIPKILTYIKNRDYIVLLYYISICLMFLLSIYLLNKHPYVSGFYFE